MAFKLVLSGSFVNAPKIFCIMMSHIISWLTTFYLSHGNMTSEYRTDGILVLPLVESTFCFPPCA
jgi:hypothetical protein